VSIFWESGKVTQFVSTRMHSVAVCIRYGMCWWPSANVQQFLLPVCQLSWSHMADSPTNLSRNEGTQ